MAAGVGPPQGLVEWVGGWVGALLGAADRVAAVALPWPEELAAGCGVESPGGGPPDLPRVLGRPEEPGVA
ncbi:MAG: hypothetical protein ACYCZN_02190 [Candidatus Dormibacteria bacterium]